MLNRTLTTLIVLFSLVGQGAAVAQGVMEVTTDRSSYAYGEVIKINATISNPTDDTFELVGSSSCQAQFLFDNFDSYQNTICTADEYILEFGPGSERTWTWEITPSVHGLPTSDGEHTIVAYFPGSDLADTIRVDAPEYLGGRLSVGIEQGISSDQLAPLRDTLSAEIVSSFETSRGLSETWEISGISLDQAIDEYSGDSRFRYFEITRMIQYAFNISTEDTPGGAAGMVLSSPYPNPCSSECFVRLDLPTSQAVQIVIFDLLGRELLVVHNGYLRRDSNHRLTIDAARLANGAYVLRAIGRSYSTARLLQIVD